jgi:hypothetical protein
LSWIVKDLWATLDNRRGEFENLWADKTLRAFEIINWIANEVGDRWDVLIQINFPPGQERPTPSLIGRKNVSILVDKNKKNFESVTEDDVKRAIQPLGPVSFDPARFGHEGFRANLHNGRVDCLASGVHLWCNITPQVLEFLDWLFMNEYGLSPHPEPSPLN